MEPIPKYPLRLPGSFWGLATFFNPVGYRNKRQNYRRFRKNSKRQGLNLLTVELAFGSARFELKKGDADILIQLRTQSSVLWQKERLLNIGLQHLPEDCDKIAWLDADIIFYNDNWIEQTYNLLESYVIVQPYSFGIGLPRRTYSINPDGLPFGNREGQKIHGMAYGIANFGREQLGDYLKHGHTGYAWAGRRSVFDKHGFYDRLILVTGDKFMGYAFYGSKNPKMQSPYSKKMIIDQNKWIDEICAGVKDSVYYTEGIIVHLWHGQYQDRLYWYTKELLKKYDFDPHKDIELDGQNLWKWATHKMELHKQIREYFNLRKEE